MKINRLKITNFEGISAAEFDLALINIFAGLNEAGKSSIKESIEWLLTGNVRALKNEEQRAALIHGDAKATEVSMDWTNGGGLASYTRRKTLKGNGAPSGEAPNLKELGILLCDTGALFCHE